MIHPSELFDRYKTAFDLAPIGMALLDNHGVLLEANDAWCAIVGYEPGELVGREVGDVLLLDDEYATQVEMANVQVASGNTKLIGELPMRRKDGSIVWVHSETTIVMGDDGKGKYVVNLMADVSERRRLEALLEHQATHDPLTGLPNRTVLEQALTAALHDAGDDSGTVAVLFVDLDGFKPVNDRYGHDVGDQLLVHVAERLRGVVRSNDIAARHGGDEFVVLCNPVSGPAEAIAVADRIVQALARPFLLPPGEIRVGASVGVALGDHRSAPELLRAADAAMYRAKDQGRGRTVLA